MGLAARGEADLRADGPVQEGFQRPHPGVDRLIVEKERWDHLTRESGQGCAAEAHRSREDLQRSGRGELRECQDGARGPEDLVHARLTRAGRGLPQRATVHERDAGRQIGVVPADARVDAAGDRREPDQVEIALEHGVPLRGDAAAVLPCGRVGMRSAGEVHQDRQCLLPLAGFEDGLEQVQELVRGEVAVHGIIRLRQALRDQSIRRATSRSASLVRNFWTSGNRI